MRGAYHVLVTPTFRSYKHLVRYILEQGEVTPSRVGPMSSSAVGKTREVRGLVYELSPGDEVWRPGYSRKLAWTEALHLLAGTFDAEHFQAVSPKAAGMFTAGMAYGPRVQPQLARVATELKVNPHSRRAIVYVGGPQDSGAEIPCTSTIQFLLRAPYGEASIPRLETYVSMRSWDMVLGLPYDVFMFGALALAMGSALNVPTGKLVVSAASAHVYEKHWDVDWPQFDNVMGSFRLVSDQWSHTGRGDTIYYLERIAQLAQRDLEGCPWADGNMPSLLVHRAPSQ